MSMKYKYVLRYFYVGIILLVIFVTVWFTWLFVSLPSIERNNWSIQTPSIRITDREGRILYEAIQKDGGRNTVVSLKSIPMSLKNATLATEDQSFYQNSGVEPTGIIRAFWINILNQGITSGGSTITQQVARTILMSQDERTNRSLIRKIREAFLALQLTKRYSKDEILSIYLNQTYYGGMNYGVEAAAETYFGKNVNELSLAESALLAGIPQTPSIYNPYTNPETAIERRNLVLGLMLKQGMITINEYEEAEQEPLFLSSAPFPMEAPHFVMWIRAEVDKLLTEDQIKESGGIIIKTSLDLNWQHIAEEAVDYQLKTVGSSVGQKNHNMNNAAVVIIDPISGQIRALVGSPDYFDDQHQGAINMASTPRQPGSALKPFIYALAMDPTLPEPWTASTMILDVTTNFLTKDGSSYIPTNYNQQENGPVLLRQALSSSLNIPAVITLDHIGLERLLDFFQKIGIDISGLRDKDISLALGGGEMSLLDLTKAYGVLANNGCDAGVVTILSIENGESTQLFHPTDLPPKCVMDQRIAWLISDILSDDSARQLGFPPNSVLNIGRKAAVKTGTTTNFHDNWTVGYTPDVVVGVWVGNASNEAMRDVTGLSGAGPIWHSIIRSILTGTKENVFSRPDGLQKVEICSLSGMLPSDACPYTRMEWFIAGTEPQIEDTMYIKVPQGISSGQNLGIDDQIGDQSVGFVLNLPISAQNWAHSHGLTLLSDLSGGPQESEKIQNVQKGILIQTPKNGSVYIFSKAIPVSDQQIQISIVTNLSGGKIDLLWNGKLFTSTTDSSLTTWLPLLIGKHNLIARITTLSGDIMTSEPVNFEVREE
jgi:penicillin-binding protein 1C